MNVDGVFSIDIVLILLFSIVFSIFVDGISPSALCRMPLEYFLFDATPCAEPNVTIIYYILIIICFPLN